MKKIYFVTGNFNKLKEARKILGIEIESICLNIPEIQAIKVTDVVKEKAKYAYKKIKQKILIEDTGVYFEGMNRFPGALIKWLINSVGNEGIVKLLSKFKNKNAYAETILCLYDGKKFEIFSGRIKGKIVGIRGNNGFGWDPIFEVEKMKKTFAEMTDEEKNNCSMRKNAFEKMKKFLNLNKDNL